MSISVRLKVDIGFIYKQIDVKLACDTYNWKRIYIYTRWNLIIGTICRVINFIKIG